MSTHSRKSLIDVNHIMVLFKCVIHLCEGKQTNMTIDSFTTLLHYKKGVKRINSESQNAHYVSHYMGSKQPTMK